MITALYSVDRTYITRAFIRVEKRSHVLNGTLFLCFGEVVERALSSVG